MTSDASIIAELALLGAWVVFVAWLVVREVRQYRRENSPAAAREHLERERCR